MSVWMFLLLAIKGARDWKVWVFSSLPYNLKSKTDLCKIDETHKICKPQLHVQIS